MSRIFVCYRREDEQAFVGRIYDRLVARYGRDSVFMDIDTIPPGSVTTATHDAFREYASLFHPLWEWLVGVGFDLRRLPSDHRRLAECFWRIAHGNETPGAVAVIGSGIHDNTHRLDCCHALGECLGTSGHRLVHGGGDVCMAVAQSFARVNPDPDYLLNLSPKGRKRPGFGTMVYFEGLEQLRAQLAELGSFFIAIGGRRGTAREVELAGDLQKEVYRLPDDLRVARTATSPGTVSPSDSRSIHDLTGQWFDPADQDTAYFRQDGDQVTGFYDLDGRRSKVGRYRGTFRDGVFNYRWRWLEGPRAGSGRMEISRDGNSLTGVWWDGEERHHLGHVEYRRVSGEMPTWLTEEDFQGE